jgi:hypothetical protein
VISGSELVSIAVQKLDLNSRVGATGELKTDSAISKGDSGRNLSGRELEAVSTDWLVPSTGTSMELGSGPWDQFETNRRLYNVTSTYDENIYTKRLDKSTLSVQQQRSADRLAREIEGSVSDNVHLQEERGQMLEREIDEEDMYSGVTRGNDDVWARGKNIISSTKKGTKEKDNKGGIGQSQTSRVKTSPPPEIAHSVLQVAAVGPPPGLSLNEKPQIPEEVAIVEVAPTKIDDKDVKTEPVKEVTEEKPKALNPNSKPFVMRATAIEFKPTGISQPPPPPAAVASMETTIMTTQGMYAPHNPYPVYGPPVNSGFIPLPNGGPPLQYPPLPYMQNMPPQPPMGMGYAPVVQGYDMYPPPMNYPMQYGPSMGMPAQMYPEYDYGYQQPYPQNPGPGTRGFNPRFNNNNNQGGGGGGGQYKNNNYNNQR